MAKLQEHTYYGSETPPSGSPWFVYPPAETPTALPTVALAFAFGFVLPLIGAALDGIGLVVGILAVIQVRRGRAQGMRRAVAAIVMSALVLVGYAVLVLTGHLA